MAKAAGSPGVIVIVSETRDPAVPEPPEPTVIDPLTVTDPVTVPPMNVAVNVPSLLLVTTPTSPATPEVDMVTPYGPNAAYSAALSELPPESINWTVSVEVFPGVATCREFGDAVIVDAEPMAGPVAIVTVDESTEE